MTDVIIDLETLSTRPHAVILVLAGIKFNRNDDIPPLEKMDTFYRRIEISSCTDIYLHTDSKTVKWWEEQKEDVREEAFRKERFPLHTVLAEFTAWFGSSRYIWGHGASFDPVILSEAYIRSGLEAPWKFWDIRDTRTLYDISGVSPGSFPNDHPHNALYDCYSEVQALREGFKRLKRK